MAVADLNPRHANLCNQLELHAFEAFFKPPSWAALLQKGCWLKCRVVVGGRTDRDALNAPFNKRTSLGGRPRTSRQSLKRS